MADSCPRELFLESLMRCTESEEFIPTFYRSFLASSEEVKNKFRSTDFQSQNKMLLRSLRLIAGATVGDTESLHELRERAETHDRYHLNIRPELYDLWREALIDTAKEFDPNWDTEIHSAWKTILGHAVAHMVRHY